MIALCRALRWLIVKILPYFSFSFKSFGYLCGLRVCSSVLSLVFPCFFSCFLSLALSRFYRFRWNNTLRHSAFWVARGHKNHDCSVHAGCRCWRFTPTTPVRFHSLKSICTISCGCSHVFVTNALLLLCCMALFSTSSKYNSPTKLSESPYHTAVCAPTNDHSLDSTLL